MWSFPHFGSGATLMFDLNTRLTAKITSPILLSGCRIEFIHAPFLPLSS
jgi:hypothetical protein